MPIEVLEGRLRSLGIQKDVLGLRPVGKVRCVKLLRDPFVDGLDVGPPPKRLADATQLFLERDRRDIGPSPSDEIREFASIERVQVLDIPLVAPLEKHRQSVFRVPERRIADTGR